MSPAQAARLADALRAAAAVLDEVAGASPAAARAKRAAPKRRRRTVPPAPAEPASDTDRALARKFLRSL